VRDYSPKRRTALLFTGSGSTGAYHAGVLRALDESGVKIDLVVGSGIGAVADSALIATDWVRYASGTVVPGTAPVWLVAMWMLFATTLNVSLRWLRRYALAAIALGAYPITRRITRRLEKLGAQVEALANSGVEKYDIPAFLRKQAD